ncbi:ABC transporter substrate-binding protein [Qingshengfaniella alkalisoli]|uniref:ABC transporter substrate-binding protein n=1 Tax=Qingshengfaniella alkalisoli TaxID=2599296 RepID=A0A5B8J138_9RHOB|nr:ABC transporter substrate-binding protein [Qingshengfaniella alkalisoli]QDY71483.1 ABC transporter substrate-binding protein [Qingshengfaniella alkalisoli]
MNRILAALLALGIAPLHAESAPDPSDWDVVLETAKGQTVYWNAWGGSVITNEFIAWVAERVSEDFGVTLEHVKLSDTADAVTRVVAEKAAGKDEGGAVDLIWINGANFAAMKENDLLFGPWVNDLPNWQYVDVHGKTVQTDFTVPTDGLEAPWSMAQVVFMYDAEKLPAPPTNMQDILDLVRDNPGRFTFPQPPDFLGATFLKQALYDLADDPAPLLKPVQDADYDSVTAPLWAYLDELTPLLWRQGLAYPQSGPQQIQLLADKEIDLAISFSPGEASAAIENFELPDTFRTFVLEKGTIGNASFVAVPYNANAKSGAMVVANFLMSPEAQARAQDPKYLGVGTILDMDKLDESDRALFDDIDLGVATLTPEELGTALPEPHPSWMTRIQDDWTERFGVGRE